MDIKSTNNQFSSRFFVLGFVFLILLSPCKVRNSIESALEIPQTNSLNKSLSSHVPSCEISNSDLAEFSSIETASNQSSKAFLSAGFFSTNLVDLSIAKLQQFHAQVKESTLAVYIPFYILYLNFKISL